MKTNLTFQTLVILTLLLIASTSSFATQRTWNGSVSTDYGWAANWTPSGVPASTDTITIIATTNTCYLDQGRTVSKFTMTSGTMNLNDSTLTITGTATFNSGTINNGALSILNGSATTTFNGTTFGATITAVSAVIAFNGSVFNAAVIADKTGSTTSVGTGSNTFNAPVTLIKSGSGAFTLAANTGQPDIFNSTLHIIQGSSGNFNIAHNSTGNEFNGAVTFSSRGAGAIFSNYYGTAIYKDSIILDSLSCNLTFGNSTGSCIQTTGHRIVIGPHQFNDGTFTLRNFTQQGTTDTLHFSATADAVIAFESGSVFNSPVNVSTPRLYLNRSRFNSVCSFIQNGASTISDGGCYFAASTTIKNNSNTTGAMSLGVTYTDTFASTAYIQCISNRMNLNNMVFLGNTTLRNDITSGVAFHVANSGHLVFKGNVTLMDAGGTFDFGNSGGTTLLDNGAVLSITTPFTGPLILENFTQRGPDAISFTGPPRLELLGGNEFNAPFTYSGGRVKINGTTFNSSADITRTLASAADVSDGGNVFNGAATITDSSLSARHLTLANLYPDTFNAAVTFIEKGSNTTFIRPAYGANSVFKGNVTVQGSAAIPFGANGGKVIFSGSANQTLNKTGSFGPTFKKIELNKTAGTLKLNVPVTLTTDSFILTSGALITDATNILTVPDNGIVIATTHTGYVHGPIKKYGNDAFTFPLGDTTLTDSGFYWHPLAISAPATTGTGVSFTAQYFAADHGHGTNAENTIEQVSTCEYWNLEKSDGTAADSVNVALNWNGNSCNAINPADMRVAYWDVTPTPDIWRDKGNGAYTGNSTVGSVTTQYKQSSFGHLTLANKVCTSLSTTASATSTSCNGGSNGTATATPSLGTPPYTYLWSPGEQTTQTATGLSANTYTVIVTDQNGCTSTTDTVVDQPSALSATITARTNVNCYGGNNGTATASSNGTSPFTYAWSGGATTQTASSLSAGTYSVIVTDVHSCSASTVATITQPTDLTTAPSNNSPVCGGVAFTLLSSASGGTSPYTYSWSGPDNFNSSSANPSVIAIDEPYINGNTGVYHYVNSGYYHLSVTDSNGCVSGLDSTNVIVYLRPAGNLFADGDFNDNTSICIGDTAHLHFFLGGYGTITGTLSDGTIFIGEEYDIQINVVPTSYTNYSVTSLSDGHGCYGWWMYGDAAVNVTNISITPSTTAVTCYGGSNGTASISPSGGNSPYTYSWNTGATTSAISGLSVGTYAVMVTEDGGCTKTGNAIITQPSVLIPNAGDSILECSGDSVTLGSSPTATGGTSPYTYSWSPTTGLSSASAANPKAYPSATTNYVLTLTDAKGCQRTDTTIVNVPYEINLANNSSGVDYSFSNGNDLWFKFIPDSPLTIFQFLPSGTYSTTNIGKIDIYTGNCSDLNLALSNTFSETDSVYQNQNILFNLPDTSSHFFFKISRYSSVVNGFDLILSTPPLPPIITAVCTNLVANGDFSNYNAACVIAANATIPVNPCPNPFNTTQFNPPNCIPSWFPSHGSPNFSAGAQFAHMGTCAVQQGEGVIQNIAPLKTNRNYLLTFSYLTSPGNTIANVAFTNGQATNGFNCFGCGVLAPGVGAAIPAFGGQQYSWSSATTWTTTFTCFQPTGAFNQIAFWPSTTNNINPEFMDLDNVKLQVLDDTLSDVIICKGACATIGPLCSISNVNYSWSTGATTSSITVCPTTSTTYTLTVCVAGVNIVGTGNPCCFSLPVSVNVSNSNISINTIGPSCHGVCDGSASATVTEGCSPYTYLWDCAGTHSTASNINNVCGPCSVTVRDNCGCISTKTFTITDPAALTASISGTPSCLSPCNGSATITTIGGTLPYTYSWTCSSSTTNSATGLCAGICSVIVTDAHNCSITSTYTLTDQTISLTASQTQTCSNMCNGTATVTPSGGTFPYAYSWSPVGQTNQTATGLCVGSYSVVVTDFYGCTSTTPVVVSEYPAPTIFISGTLYFCSGGSTQLTANGSSGTTPYNYSWSTGETTQSITATSSGTYTVLLTDANGCTATTTAVITPFLSASATVVSYPFCYGSTNGSVSVTTSGGSSPYTYLWSPGNKTTQTLTGLSAGFYTVVVTDHYACTKSSSINLTQPNTLIIHNSQNNVQGCQGVSCNGAVSLFPNGGTTLYTYSWSPGGQTTSGKTGLCAGTYSVRVTDAHGCSATSTYTITEPPSLTSTITQKYGSCSGPNSGSATVTPAGGTPAYTYSWSTSPAQTTSTAGGLGAGTYSVLITDHYGCTTTSTFTILGGTAPTITTDYVDACTGLCNGIASVTTATGGTSPYNYSWVPGGKTTQTITGLCLNTYTTIVTDANACSVTQTFTISSTNDIPDAPVITGNPFFCDADVDQDYVIQNIPTSTHSYDIRVWEYSPNDTLVMGTDWSMTGNIIHVTWHNDLGGKIIISVKTSNSCYATSIFYIQRCCSQGGGLTFKGTPSSPLYPPGIDAQMDFNVNGTIDQTAYMQHITINGTLEINSDYTIYGNVSGSYPNKIYMASGSKIIVRSGITLTLTNCYLEAGCGNMWKGIELEPGARLVVYNTQIYDAENAILANGGSSYRLNDPPANFGDKCVFGRNYNCIKIMGNNAMASGSIRSTDFNGSALKTNYGGQVEYEYNSPIPYSNAGVVTINTPNVTIGSATLDPFITFNRLNYGVFSINSNTVVNKCLFKNILKSNSSNRPYAGAPDIAMGVYSVWAPRYGGSSGSITVKGFGQVAKPSFDKCTYGIYINGTRAANGFSPGITQNNMTNMVYGICTVNHNITLNSVSIYENKINASNTGINCQRNGGAAVIISTNQVNMSATGIAGINVDEGTGTNNYSVQSNLVDMSTKTGGSFGIRFNAVQTSTIQQNDITTDGTNIDGILLTGSRNNIVNCNSAHNRSGIFYYALTNGYRGVLSQSNQISCNNFNHTEKGFLFWGVNSQNVLKGNDMGQHKYGVHFLIPTSVIGLQTQGNQTYCHGNKWNSSTTLGIKAAILSSFNKFYYPSPLSGCSSLPVSLSTLHSTETPSGFFTPMTYLECSTFTCQTFTCQAPSGGGNNFISSADVETDSLDIAIADNSILSPSAAGYYSAFRFITKYELYKKLKNEPSLITAGLFTNFYDSAEVTNIGLFSAVEDSIEAKQEMLRLIMAPTVYNDSVIDTTLAEVRANEETIFVSSDLSEIDSLMEANNDLITSIQPLDDDNRALADSALEMATDMADMIAELNDPITPDTVHEQNLKTVNEILLHTVAKGIYEFTDEQVSSLQEIAAQCPDEGGRAVFIARALYAAVNPSVTYNDLETCTGEAFDLDDCELPDAVSEISGPSTALCGLQDQTYSIETISNATGYKWYIAGAGASIDGPDSLTTVTVDFSDTVSSVTIYVAPRNDCGYGSPGRLDVYTYPRLENHIPESLEVCPGDTSVFTVPEDLVLNLDSATICCLDDTISWDNNPATVTVLWSNEEGERTLSLYVSNDCGTDVAFVTITTLSCRKAEYSNKSKESVAQQIKVYPNPARDAITVEFKGDENEKYNIQITDLVGRVVLADEGKSKIGINRKQLNISMLSKGMYFLNLKSSFTNDLVRIIIE